MKLSHQTGRSTSAFTLVECLIAMVTTSIVVAGIVSVYIYGIRMRQLTESKLSATDDARRAVSLMGAEIRSAYMVKVGSGGMSSFSEPTMGAPQVGSAIQIYPGTNLTQFIRYFRDASDSRLKRTTNGVAASTFVAGSISNAMVFQAEDHLGNILTNNLNNRVIAVSLNFFKPQNAGVSFYDYYQLRTKFTRRTIL